VPLFEEKLTYILRILRSYSKMGFCCEARCLFAATIHSTSGQIMTSTAPPSEGIASEVSENRVTHDPTSRLERSCKSSFEDWVRAENIAPGLKRIEAEFSGHAYDRHRHDAYAMGYTIAGVLSFGYRGKVVNSLPGACMVIHPDEVHDGHAGTATGFLYRMIYVDPSLVRKALGETCRALPFVKEAVQNNPRLHNALQIALSDFNTPLESLQIDTFLTALTDVMVQQISGIRDKSVGKINHKAVYEARTFLESSFARKVASEELELITGLDRFAIARHFRGSLGTSPYQYLISRRLEEAQKLIATDLSLSSIAFETGFADQSHMTRHFKRAYGVTPNGWRKLVAAGAKRL
jgi:AraC-like DNA-binding protein